VKKISGIAIVLMLAYNGLQAQVKKTAVSSVPAKTNAHLKTFDLAIASGDAATAVTALNYYLSEGDGNSNYADTLAMLYMQLGSFSQCYYWASKRLETAPENATLLELKGICLDKLNQPKEAIDIFEKLFKKSQSPYHAYKLMELQYGIKRLSECLATAAAAEKLAYKPEYLMTYNFGQQTGRTYLQAGVYNIHALVLYDLDKKAEAKIYFEKALALDSTFALAKQNLDALTSLEAGGGTKAAMNQPTGAPATPAKKEN
jgi:tetratricopeptide (TPR) repeat protein